ncbi:MAG: OmpA family protein [Terriglobales bacterium]
MDCSKTRTSRSLWVTLCAVLMLSFLSLAAFAQDQPVPKYDIFTGYQWAHPGGTVPSPFGSYNAPIGQDLPDAPWGIGAAVARNFGRFLAVEGDYGKNWTTDGKGTNEQTLSVGPRFMFRSDNANFFVHTLISWNQLSAPGLASDNGIGAILGGGIDMPLTHLITLRVIEGDYVWGRHNYASEVSSSFPDLRRPELEGLRLRTGILWNFGYPPATTPSAACSVQPSEVMVGEPITATTTASNFNPKHTLNYAWTGTGGKVTGNNNTASIDTNGVAGGTYTVTSTITDPKLKKAPPTTCSATYTVKEPPKNPPTMSCSANPTSLQAGGSVTVTCTCTSPDGVPVNVNSWTASGGTISGSGSSATENTAGAAPGAITVGATCTDSRGLSAQASTQFNIEAPPQPPAELEHRLSLHSIYFATAKPTPQNPTGGLVASQEMTLTKLADDFKTYLGFKPDAHLTLQGHADQRGTVEFNKALSERRVTRVKSFLVEHGVPADSIQTQALGKEDNLTPEQVKDMVDNNPDLSPEERTRIMKNEKVIVWASNRRVDITLSTTGQTSVKQFPFNAADSLSLIGGREADMKANTAKKRKAAPKAAPKQ